MGNLMAAKAAAASFAMRDLVSVLLIIANLLLFFVTTYVVATHYSLSEDTLLAMVALSVANVVYVFLHRPTKRTA